MPTHTERDLSAAELFREHSPFVARLLYRLGVPAHAIQDTVQEVFLVVHQRGGYRPGPAKPTSFLAMIASNAAAQQRRKARTQASRFDSCEPDQLRATGGDPARALETNDDLRRLQAALDKLEPELRTTLLLADGEDETCVSIAEAMQVPVGTVYWRLHQARKKFQRALATVDASLHRPRLSARDGRSGLAPILAVRSARAVVMVWGFITSWQGSKAQALLRETAKQMPAEFEVQAALQRHMEIVAQPAPLSDPPSPAASGTVGSATGTGALKAWGWVAAGSVALVTAVHVVSLARGPTPSGAALELPTTRASAASASVSNSGAEEVTEASPEPQGLPVTAERAHSEQALETGDGSERGPTPSSHGTPSSTSSAVRRSLRGAPQGAVHSVGPAKQTRDTLTTSAKSALQPPALPPSASPTPASTQPSVLPDDIVETQALARAEGLLRSDPAQALAITRELAGRGRAGYLAEERHYIEVRALHALHRQSDTKRAADAFLAAHPNSVFRERVNRIRGEARGSAREQNDKGSEP